MKLFLVFIILLLISCSTVPKVNPINVTTTYIPIEILHPISPDPVAWEEVKWKILTPGEMTKILQEYNSGKKLKKDIVFFALTSDGYQHLSENIAEIIRYLEGQKSVIKYYKSTVPKQIFVPKP